MSENTHLKRLMDLLKKTEEHNIDVKSLIEAVIEDYHRVNDDEKFVEGWETYFRLKEEERKSLPDFRGRRIIRP